MKSVFQIFHCIIFILIFSSLSISQTIPTPKEHFGFEIGDSYHLATFTQTEAYFKKIAAASPRAKLTIIGKTEEGRDQFMMIVTSPENHKRLEHYKSISQKLGNPDGISNDQARAMANEGKAVVWIDGGLHATETAATHQLIQSAYVLLSNNDPETNRIMDNVIILMTHANPDGQELVSNWYMRNPVPEKRSLQGVPRLYQKYVGHDNNRDFYMLNMKESQNIARQLFIDWIPQIMYNHHQSGPPGSIVAGAPYRDPFNYVIDPLIISGLDAIGAANQNRLNAEDKPGYTSKSGSVFSTWYNGGLRTTTYFHNMLGLLTEIVGSPNPSDIPLVTQRLIPNAATPNPIVPQKWLFRQSIDYSVSLNYAMLDYAARNRDQLLYNIYKMGMNSIERGSKDYWALTPSKIDKMNQLIKDGQKKQNQGEQGAEEEMQWWNRPTPSKKYYDSVMTDPALRDPRGFIIPSDQPDFATAVTFLNTLIKTGVIVHKANMDFTVNGKKYPANSYIVKTNQAFRPHVLDLFEPQDHPNDFQYPGGPPVPPYDAAGWTLAYQMGVQFDRIMDGFDGPFEKNPVGQVLKLEAKLPEISKAKAYLFDAGTNGSFKVVNALLKNNINVY
ncbi:MAG: M14 metallopeptidase family protein, partial [Saprospiraceae bacterium]